MVKVRADRFPAQIRLPTTECIRDLVKRFSAKPNEGVIRTPTKRRSRTVTMSVNNTNVIKKMSSAVGKALLGVAGGHGGPSSKKGKGGEKNKEDTHVSTWNQEKEGLEKNNKMETETASMRKASCSPLLSPQKSKETMNDNVNSDNGWRMEKVVYDTMVHRIDLLEQVITSNTNSIGDVGERLNNNTERLNMRVEDFASYAEQGIHRIDEDIKQMDNMVNEVARMVQDLSDPLNAALGRLSIVESEANDLKNMLRIMQNAMEEMKGGENLPVNSRSGLGIYIAGLDNLKKEMKLHREEDPAEAIKMLLGAVTVYYFFDRIIITDKNAQMQDAKSAIVYFGSLQQKRQAEYNIRRELGKMRARGVMIRDLFPLERMEEVRELNKKGYDMKSSGEVMRYRIINRRDVPSGPAQKCQGIQDVKPDNFEDSSRAQGNAGGDRRGETVDRADGGQADGATPMEQNDDFPPLPPIVSSKQLTGSNVTPLPTGGSKNLL